jgi:predicted ATPase
MVSSLLGRDTELRIADAVLFGRANGVMFAGPHGAGKSALLDAIALRAVELGVTVHRVHGTPALSDVSFGAATHLLVDDSTEQRQRTIRETERRLAASGGSGGTTLIVDDGQDLDTATLGLLHAVAVGRRVHLVIAVADLAAAPVSLTRLWKDAHLDRHEVAPLSRPQSRALIEARLGGPVADDVERTVWELTLGLPLFISLICESGRFDRVADLWRLSGDPTDMPQVHAAVSGLLDGVSQQH